MKDTLQTLRRGLVAGIAVRARLNFVTDGTPGRTLPEVSHWFGITIADPTISRFAGFFLLIALGGVFGLIFGALPWELALGFVWWLVFSLLLANIMSHHAPFSLDFGRFLSTFPIDLLFGVVLGAISFQLQQRRRASAV